MTITGLIGTKEGMTRVFTKDGQSVPVTVVKIPPNRVISRREDADGRVFIMLSHGEEKPLARMTKAVAGQYRAANVAGGQGLHTHEVDADSELKPADIIAMTMFEVDQYVDVSAISKGKGFQGGVKRHHFTMQPATHGNSISHRAIGSTGQCQDPGKVFKGKKMAGQMGNTRVTIQNLKIIAVDESRHVLLISGAVPGAPGSTVEVRKAVKKADSKGDES